MSNHGSTIISAAYARRLIKRGVAAAVGTVMADDGYRYTIIDRYDIQMTQHVRGVI